MQQIWDILNSLGETINTLWQYVQQFMVWLGDVIDFIFQAVRMGYEFIDSFPPWLKAFGMATILICAVYQFLGRAGGNSE